MEMPEKWNRLVDLGRAFEYFGDDYNIPKQASELLKEMAEALEEIRKSGTKEEYFPEEGTHDVCMNSNATKARDILNKFKEWK